MPSPQHEILVEVVRNRPRLACELLELCAGIQLRAVTVEVSSIDATHIAPVEYRADCVCVVRDAAGVATTAVVVESQLRADPDKHYSWPLYVATLRARLACEVTLLVLVPEPSVARWARTPIHLGHPGFTLVPIVICLAELPRLAELDRAQRTPELALLCALGHPEADEAMTALETLHEVPDDRAKLYWDRILSALPAIARKTLESRMQGHKYHSEFARKYYDQGLDEGRQEGRQEGREEGLQQAILELARAKLGEPSAGLEVSIRELHDPDLLTRLLVALGRAHDAAEARAVLETAASATDRAP